MVSFDSIRCVVGLNSLERLTKEQTEKKESKLTKIKGLFQKNAKSFLVAGLFVTVLFMLALVPDIGFTAAVYISSSQPLIRGHPCPGVPVVDCKLATSSCACLEGWVYNGTMNITFSPHLYPINHLFGSEVSTNFTQRCEPSTSRESLKKSLITQALLSEFPMNIPLFYAVGFTLALGLKTTISRAERKNRTKTY